MKDKDKENRKKKDKKTKEKIEKDEIKTPTNDFGNMIQNIGKQLTDVFQNIDPSKLQNPENINEVMKDVLKKMNMDPKNMPNIMKMNKEMMENLMKNKKGMGTGQPMVFGMNFKIGPDGIPKMEPFGNVQRKENGQTIVKDVREPLTDIIEEDDKIIVVAEMPGVEKKKIKLKATKNSITIIGSDDNDERKYEITLDLPASIDPDHAKARYNNGILEVTLEKIDKRELGKNIDIE